MIFTHPVRRPVDLPLECHVFLFKKHGCLWPLKYACKLRIRFPADPAFGAEKTQLYSFRFSLFPSLCFQRTLTLQQFLCFNIKTPLRSSPAPFGRIGRILRLSCFVKTFKNFFQSLKPKKQKTHEGIKPSCCAVCNVLFFKGISASRCFC